MTWRVDLTGHHSNPSTHLKALLDGVLGALNKLDRNERRPERRNLKRPEWPIGNRVAPGRYALGVSAATADVRRGKQAQGGG